MSKPESFNDPFEFKLKRPTSDEISKIKGIDKIIGPANSAADEHKVELILKHFETQISNFGVACFSEINDSMLMWSHYSNNHFGFTLGFDVGENPRSKGYNKVEYTKEYPEINFSEIWHKDGLMKILWTKSMDWVYEQEWRIINDEGNYSREYYVPLVEVIFGCRTKDSDIKLIKTILKNDDIKFYKAHLNRYDFRIEILPL